VFALAAAGLGGALMAGKSRRVLYGATALGVISVVASAPFLVADLSHPETGAGFVLALSAAVIGLGTAASALLATRWNPPNRARVVAIAAAGVLMLGTVGSAVATLGVEDDQRQAGDIVVASSDTTFPDELEVPAGAVGFFVENDDVYRHKILIEETDIKVELPGSTAPRFETELAPGAYRYYCDVPGVSAGHRLAVGSNRVGWGLEPPRATRSDRVWHQLAAQNSGGCPMPSSDEHALRM